MAIVELTAQSIARLKAAAVPGSLEVCDRLQRNLVLRCGPHGVRWGLRMFVHGKHTRLDLGDVDEWKIREAREIGGEANRLLRNRLGVPDRDWLLAKRVEYGKVDPAVVSKPSPKRSGWTFAEARAQYLDEVRRIRRPATHVDYKGMLNIIELRPLEDCLWRGSSASRCRRSFRPSIGPDASPTPSTWRR